MPQQSILAIMERRARWIVLAHICGSICAVAISVVVNIVVWNLVKSLISDLHLIPKILVLGLWLYLPAGSFLFLWLVFSEVPSVDELVREEFGKKFDLYAISSYEARSKVERALEYYKRVDGTVKSIHEGPLRSHMRETIRGIDDWVITIYSLAKRLTAYQADTLIHQDMHQVRADIGELTDHLKVEKDLVVKTQMQATLTSKQQYFDSLERLDSTMRRATYVLEQSIAALATVSSEVQLIDARNIDSPRARRLRQDITEQVAHLQDIFRSLDEVYHREF